MNVKWYDYDWPVISHLFVHVSDLMAFKKQESVRVIRQHPRIRGVCSPWCIGGVWRKKNTWGWGGTQADAIMPSLLCSPTPWRSRALCAVCVRSPRRSCLCFWTAAESAVYSKILLEELQRCQGCREVGRKTTGWVRHQRWKWGKHQETREDTQSPQFGVAVLAAEARRVEDQIVGNQSLHWVDRLLTWCAHFLLCLKAEGLNADMQWFTTTERQ